MTGLKKTLDREDFLEKMGSQGEKLKMMQEAADGGGVTHEEGGSLPMSEVCWELLLLKYAACTIPMQFDYNSLPLSMCSDPH